ncbi:hypothetical protein [Brachyspira pilosicoli]|uniref:hypothetical protein n=1 Tax=Brachyspira pilosicoli TaxID=52584 RepID=UPI0030042712
MILIPPIDGTSHIIRFCNPDYMDNGNFSKANFILKKGATCLSFDLLEFHNANSFDQNLRCSIDSILNRFYRDNYILKNKFNDKKYFAIIDIESLIKAVDDVEIEKVALVEPNDSHVGLYYTEEYKDEISILLLNIANKNTI